MATTNRSMRLAAYACGLAIGCLLIAATVAKAEMTKCQECRLYWSYKVTTAGPPKGACHDNPSKGCIEPILTEKCKDICDAGGITSEYTEKCTGELEVEGETPCDNKATGPCTMQSWNKYCVPLGAMSCKDAQPKEQSKTSACNVTCKCAVP